MSQLKQNMFNVQSSLIMKIKVQLSAAPHLQFAVCSLIETFKFHQTFHLSHHQQHCICLHWLFQANTSSKLKMKDKQWAGKVVDTE